MVALIPARIAIVEAMPYKNSDEMSVMIDMPPYMSSKHLCKGNRCGKKAQGNTGSNRMSEVYAGTSAPLTFLGVGRHFDFRNEPDKAEIHVQLKPAEEHLRHSETALQMHSLIKAPMLSGKNIFFTVAELPPGPPSLAAIVAEVYAPDEEQRLVPRKR